MSLEDVVARLAEEMLRENPPPPLSQRQISKLRTLFQFDTDPR